jgi:hypothetical protein
MVTGGNLLPGASLLTGDCTSPLFAYATTGLFATPYEYPVYGCAGGRPECCPFEATLVASNDPDYGIRRSYVTYITECPGDYTTLNHPSGTTSGGYFVDLCCPS